MDVDSDEQQKKVEAMKEKLTTTFKQYVLDQSCWLTQ